MLILRIVALLTGLGVIGCVLAFLLTREARYLRYAKKLGAFALVTVFVFFALLVLERVLVPLV